MFSTQVPLILHRLSLFSLWYLCELLVTLSWSKLKYVDDRFPNSNSNTATVVGTKAFYIGYYPSFYLDLAPLAFILSDGREDNMIE